MKGLSFFSKTIYVVNSLFAAILLLSYLLPFVSPNTIPIFAILSLFVPALILINFLFVIYWSIRLKKQFFLSALILLIGCFFSSPLYKISDTNTALNDDLKVMSYNVRLLNHFNNLNIENIPEKINKFIKKNNPDILILQESHNIKKKIFSYPYSYIKSKPERSKMGMAIYSKYPIINSGSFNFKKTFNDIVFADIVKQKDTIRVYNLHLQSLKLETHKENFGQENSKKLIKTLKERFKKQADQTLLFLEHEQQWKGKKIVAGDFNNTSYSWVYNQISKNKKDAFVEAGKGFGKTFNFPFPMRIDFIFADDTANINQFTSFTEEYSDHFPIQARINW